MKTPRKRGLVAGLGVCAAILAVLYSQLPAIAAGGLLHPRRTPLLRLRPPNCDDTTFSGAGVTLKGWRCHAWRGKSRGTLVYLHGIADNRASAVHAIQRFTMKGLDVVTYDGRAHGESEGEACTYGFFEKDDLKRVLDRVPTGPIVLLGASLGAAVALQGAAGDPRVKGVIAAETFSDLRTIAHERSPWILTGRVIDKAFLLAEELGRFDVDSVSPVKAASLIDTPVLLIHGRDDRETLPSHSERVLAALKGPKRLILVDRAGHNQSLLREEVWTEIDRWLESVLQSGN